MQNNLNTKLQNHRHPEQNPRHPEPSFRHPESSLRHPERSEGSQETRNTHINIGTGEDISIRELTDPSKLHAFGWKHKVELSDGIKIMYESYLNNQGEK
jgi:hypothetical protein